MTRPDRITTRPVPADTTRRWAVAAAAALALAALAGCDRASRDGGLAGPVSGGTGTGTAPVAPATGAGSSPRATGDTPGPGTPPTGSAPTGSAPAGAGTPPTGTSAVPRPTTPDRCHTADLTLSVRSLDAAAGQRYANLVLVNRSARTCSLYGYGGVQLLDAAGAPLPTRQQRQAGTVPAVLRLAPGAATHSLVHWGVVPAAGDRQTGGCQPSARTVAVIPPDETAPVRAPWAYGPVCDRGRFEQQPYAVGVS